MTLMLRVGAIFVAICMILIAASLGAILFLVAKLDARIAAIAALAALAAVMLYYNISNRLGDRAELGDQIAHLSCGTADLARQVADLSRRLAAVEAPPTASAVALRDNTDPLAVEIGELGALVLQVAETVATHAAILKQEGVLPSAADAAVEAPLALSETNAASQRRRIHGLARDTVAEMVGKAIEENRIHLYLQPIVTLPQRKVRHYETLSRLRTENDEVVLAADVIDTAENAGLLPRIDNLTLFRCVQVTRRLHMKNRDVGLFCKISAATLTDASQFRQLLDFMDTN